MYGISLNKPREVLIWTRQLSSWKGRGGGGGQIGQILNTDNTHKGTLQTHRERNNWNRNKTIQVYWFSWDWNLWNGTTIYESKGGGGALISTLWPWNGQLLGKSTYHIYYLTYSTCHTWVEMGLPYCQH